MNEHLHGFTQTKIPEGPRSDDNLACFFSQQVTPERKYNAYFNQSGGVEV